MKKKKNETSISWLGLTVVLYFVSSAKEFQSDGAATANELTPAISFQVKGRFCMQIVIIRAKSLCIAYPQKHDVTFVTIKLEIILQKFWISSQLQREQR